MTNKCNEPALRQIYIKLNTEESKLQKKYKPRNEKNKVPKRTKKMTIRYSEDEYRKLQSRSKEAGLKPTAFIRKSSLEDKINKTDPAMITRIVEMDEKINHMKLNGNDMAQTLRTEFNDLKDKYFDELGGCL